MDTRTSAAPRLGTGPGQQAPLGVALPASQRLASPPGDPEAPALPQPTLGGDRWAPRALGTADVRLFVERGKS
jgi:hypothetical protein